MTKDTIISFISPKINLLVLSCESCWSSILYFMLTHYSFSRGNTIGLCSCNFAVQDETENGRKWTAGPAYHCLRDSKLFISLICICASCLFPEEIVLIKLCSGLHTVYRAPADGLLVISSWIVEYGSFCVAMKTFTFFVYEHCLTI